MKIVVAHPNMQHSFRLAASLENEGLLGGYVTTVYDRPGSLTRLMGIVAGNSFRSKIQKKKCKDIFPEHIQQFCELEGILFLVMIRIPFLKKFYRNVGLHLKKRFGKKVAKYVLEVGADVVVMYDTTACACFENLAEWGCDAIRVIDMSSMASESRIRTYEQEVVDEDRCRLKVENAHFWNEKFREYNNRELNLCDYVLSPSSFVSKSLAENGVGDEKIRLLRYGVDLERFPRLSNVSEQKGPINLVYTGGVTYGKGVHHLLRAAVSLPAELLSLTLIGAYSADSSLYREYCTYSNIVFRGFVSQDELREIYRQSNVFVFPSLGEGFSLACVEALACGLPLVCTSSSGVNDIVNEKRNGIVVPPSDEPALAKAIKWFVNHKSELPLMGEHARESVSELSWTVYGKNAVKIMSEIVSEKGR